MLGRSSLQIGRLVLCFCSDGLFAGCVLVSGIDLPLSAGWSWTLIERQCFSIYPPPLNIFPPPLNISIFTHLLSIFIHLLSLFIHLSSISIHLLGLDLKESWQMASTSSSPVELSKVPPTKILIEDIFALKENTIMWSAAVKWMLTSFSCVVLNNCIMG